MRPRLRQSFTIVAWSVLWIVFFWTFLVTGFPTETARGWLAGRLGQGLGASVSIEALHVKWNLDVRLKGVSLARRTPESGSSRQGERPGEGLTIRFDSVTVEPRFSGLISGRPEVHFRGDTSFGGSVSGSYKSGEVALAFRDLSVNDVRFAALPVPSGATVSGSGRFHWVRNNGTIETELDGVPGGTQRMKILGGEGPGVDGMLKIRVSLPKS